MVNYPFKNYVYMFEHLTQPLNLKLTTSQQYKQDK